MVDGGFGFSLLCAGAWHFELHSVCDSHEHVLDCVPLEVDLLSEGTEDVVVVVFPSVGSSYAFC